MINPEKNKGPLVKLLIRLKQDYLWTQDRINQVLDTIKKQDLSLPAYLLAQEQIDSDWLAIALSEILGLPRMDLDTLDPSQIPLNVINEKLLRQYPILPLWIRDEQLWVGLADPTQHRAITALRFQTGLAITLVILSQTRLNHLREALLQSPQLSLQALEKSFHKPSVDKTTITKAEDPPLIRYVNRLLQTAFYKRASDIHFEPQGLELRLRFRIDGILYLQEPPPAELRASVIARLKVMSQLDIAERRLPQDGRFQFLLPNKQTVDCRISTCPTLDGEKIVVRLQSSHVPLDITALGLNAQQLSIFLSALHQPQGMLLVTGPTGSGKTLTLYSALHTLNTSEVNIASVEDPVEIYLLGINQVNIHPKIGLDFSTFLETFLRQDPDILMLSEMRTKKTIKMGIRAAQTGHLVLSTLHTNSATETLTRLRNMGVPGFDIASSLSLIVAQRLLRCLCVHCKRKTTLPEQTLAEMSLEKNQGLDFFTAQGCQYCIQGYHGRIGIFELLPITDKISSSILQEQPASQIACIAAKEGMLTLRQSALEKLKQGLISLAEMNRVLG